LARRVLKLTVPSQPNLPSLARSITKILCTKGYAGSWLHAGDEDVFTARCRWDFPLLSRAQYKNMVSGSYYVPSPLPMRSCPLAPCDYCFALRGPALASSRRLGRDAHPLCRKLSTNGLARSSTLPPLSTTPGTVACRCRLDCAAHTPARSLFQCLLSRHLP